MKSPPYHTQGLPLSLCFIHYHCQPGTQCPPISWHSLLSVRETRPRPRPPSCQMINLWLRFSSPTGKGAILFSSLHFPQGGEIEMGLMWWWWWVWSWQKLLPNFFFINWKWRQRWRASLLSAAEKKRPIQRGPRDNLRSSYLRDDMISDYCKDIWSALPDFVPGPKINGSPEWWR